MKDKKQQEKSPKKKEQLSRKEIEHLMGMDRPVYTRHKGAIRQK